MNNSLLAGLPKTLLAELQRCQNIAARIITRTPSADHITPVLMNLAIEYKLLYVYRALNGKMAPTYITEPAIRGRTLFKIV